MKIHRIACLAVCGLAWTAAEACPAIPAGEANRCASTEILIASFQVGPDPDSGSSEAVESERSKVKDLLHKYGPGPGPDDDDPRETGPAEQGPDPDPGWSDDENGHSSQTIPDSDPGESEDETANEQAEPDKR